MNPAAQRLVDGKRQHLLPCLYHFYADPPVLVRPGALSLDILREVLPGLVAK